jgi:hypothetical protein
VRGRGAIVALRPLLLPAERRAVECVPVALDAALLAVVFPEGFPAAAAVEWGFADAALPFFEATAAGSGFDLVALLLADFETEEVRFT